MDACQACSNFFHVSVAPSTVYERTLSLGERRRVVESAQSCQLCRLISIALGKDNNLKDYDEELAIWTELTESPFKVDEGRISSIQVALLSNEQRLLSDERKYPLGRSFSVWAEECGSAPDKGDVSTKEGIASFGSFVDWPPSTHPSLTDISSATQRLLNNCLNHHSGCGLSVTELQEEFELPSRVISLQDDAGILSARLLETKGLKGTYCALSHCWGLQDKYPLKTTRENIRSYLESIPWNSLPRTFREAMSLVSELGLKYLWIDSLCIIQDNKEDWEKQATRMASVYRKAVLVIAAANSKDSTEGLLGPQLQLSRPSIFRCPITVHDGSDQAIHQGTMIQIASNNIHNVAREEPLGQRGWVFQEWYLGRRKVFFTSRGICWKCNDAELDSHGQWADLSFYEDISWLHCLEVYSGKKLTFPSDRMKALLGIVGKMQEARSDSFAIDFGVWEQGLEDQLLWRHTEAPCYDFPGLPSWCWAATGGEKHWVTKDSNNCLSPAVVNRTTQTINLTQSGSLKASGLLIRATTPSSCFRECCLPGHSYRDSLEDSIRPGHCGEKDNAERFPIYHVGGTHSILGIGAFDNCAYPPEYFCFILSFKKRSVLDPLYCVSDSEDFESRDCENSGSQYRDSEYGDSERGKPKRGDSESSNSEYAHPESEDYESGDYEFEDLESGGSEFLSYETEEELATQTEKLGIDSEGAGAEGSGGDVESTDESYSPYAQEDVHECPDLSEVEMSLGAYWSLLLEPVDDTMRRFRRVGMALIYPRGLKTIDYEVKTFEIV